MLDNFLDFKQISQEKKSDENPLCIEIYNDMPNNKQNLDKVMADWLFSSISENFKGNSFREFFWILLASNNQ